MKIIRIAPLALLLAVPGLQADFSYEQKTEMTGGAMQAAMKMASKFSKQVGQAMDTKTAVKGRRMASITQDQRIVTDLDAKTITTVDLKKKEYSVVTFEQMREYMEKMAQKVKKKDAEVNFTVSVEKTDNEKMVEGMPAKEIRLKMKIQGKNPETGDSGQMDMLMQSWMTDPVRGYSEIREFYEEYGKELNWTPGGNMSMFSMAGQGSQQGMAEMQEELAKMNGMPIVQVVSMGSGDLTQPAASGGGGQGGGSAEDEPDPMASLKKGLGGLGGFGGFGKKKKEPKQEEQPQAASTQNAPAGNSGKLMEMTITYSNYSSAPVDAALVDTEPAGFKLVKSDIEKALR